MPSPGLVGGHEAVLRYADPAILGGRLASATRIEYVVVVAWSSSRVRNSSQQPRGAEPGAARLAAGSLLDRAEFCGR
jgi:hypothetical protein